MPEDLSLPEITEALQDGEFKTWMGSLPALPGKWTYCDILTGMIQAAQAVQVQKNSGKPPGERLNVYSATVTGLTVDPATGEDTYRKVSSVTVLKSVSVFDAENTSIVIS